MTAKKTTAKKVTDPKTVVVDKPPKGTPTPRHRKTGEKYRAPKLVRKKPLTREQQAALNQMTVKGQ